MEQATELQGMFDDQPEAETVETETVADGLQTESEANQQEPSAEVETSSHDDTQPSVKRVQLALEGEDYELELPETIADHVKNGVLMESKFRRDTQTLAEQRREFEAQREEALQKQEQMLEELGSQLLFLKNELESDEMQDLKDLSPNEYLKKKVEYQEKLETYKRFNIEQNEKFKRENEKKQAEFAEQERQKLTEIIPEWLDNDTRKEDQKKVMSYALEAGFDEDEVRQIGQARLVKVFRDAALYNEAKTKLSSKAKTPKPTTLKANSKSTIDQPKQLHEFFYGD